MSGGSSLLLLLIAAILSIILGMGMPTAGVYILLATLVAPALINVGFEPLAAHLFIFYFGVMSFLTPPVAVSSFVAAGVAGAGMWTTGWAGMRLSAVAFLIPFVWAYDPALLLDGSPLAVAVVIATTLGAVMLIARGQELLGRRDAGSRLRSLAMAAGVVVVGTSPIWLGGESVLALALGVGAVATAVWLPRIADPEPRTVP